MELMAAAAAKSGAAADVIRGILDCVSVDDAYEKMKKAGIEQECFAYIMERIDMYLKRRSPDMEISCIVFSNKYGLLGMTGAQCVEDGKDH